MVGRTDIHRSTARAVEEIVTQLQAKGYTLVTVPELLGTMDASKAYYTGARWAGPDDPGRPRGADTARPARTASLARPRRLSG
ncbi:hypothetical protein [Luteococcus peritonei]|uniref:Resolvase/invertase-type recombinase catalytic domain-containing protein n=1 Tax=Luteococcus peritonei TaxID=88874 RepID=A0ABW4RUS8_9ACTN